MADHPTWFQGDMNPAITDEVTIDGVPVDLTSLTVRFKMRAFGSSTLKVNQPVSTKNAQGVWTYNWATTDLDTVGSYLVWVEVDLGGGAVETVNEAPIVVAAHAPGANAYIELEEFKSAAHISSTTYKDEEAKAAIIAASRALDNELGRRFYLDTDANQIRYYSPLRQNKLWIDDLVTLTELATDRNGGSAFGETWTANSDYILEPLNAPADGWPFTAIARHPRSSLYFPTAYPRSVRVKGKFGWTAIPQPIKDATLLVASRLLQRKTLAPFGILSLGAEGAVVRASSFVRDPEIMLLVGPYSRNSGLA